MSHFTEIQCNFDQKSEKDLIASLEEEFGAGSVEVHDEGAALYGYHGDNRAKLSESNPNYAPPCHIIVRRKTLGSASNDVGYRRLENGKYAAYISEYDQRTNFDSEKQGRVMQNYSSFVAERTLKKQGWIVKKTKLENGVIKLEGTSYKK